MWIFMDDINPSYIILSTVGYIPMIWIVKVPKVLKPTSCCILHFISNQLSRQPSHPVISTWGHHTNTNENTKSEIGDAYGYCIDIVRYTLWVMQISYNQRQPTLYELCIHIDIYCRYHITMFKILQLHFRMVSLEKYMLLVKQHVLQQYHIIFQLCESY